MLTFFTRLAGDFDYADKWARAAIGGVKTAFTNGLYDGDFDTLPTLTSGVARRTAAGKGATFLTTWIYSIGMFEEAVNLCGDTTANTAALGFWDKGVAYYTVPLEGSDNNSKTSTHTSNQSFKVGYKAAPTPPVGQPQAQQLTA